MWNSECFKSQHLISPRVVVLVSQHGPLILYFSCAICAVHSGSFFFFTFKKHCEILNNVPCCSLQDYRQLRNVKLAQELSNEPVEGTDPSSGSHCRDNNPNFFMCQICYNERVNRLLLPCRHAKMCAQCIEQLNDPRKCPFCREVITGTELIYT